MKYAIIEISGRQFWVEVGKYYDFNRVPAKLGKTIILNRVLLINNGIEISIGRPYIKEAKIEAKILEHLRDKKKVIYKMRSKKKTRKKLGHRQELTRVLIKNITL